MLPVFAGQEHTLRPLLALYGNMTFTNTQKAEAIAAMVEDSVQNDLNENTENTLNLTTSMEVQK